MARGSTRCLRLESLARSTPLVICLLTSSGEDNMMIGCSRRRGPSLLVVVVASDGGAAESISVADGGAIALLGCLRVVDKDMRCYLSWADQTRFPSSLNFICCVPSL